LELVRTLRVHGLPVPETLAARDGDVVVSLGGRLYVATAALPGTPYDPAEPAHLRQAGRVLARYHAIAAGLPAQGPDAGRPQVLDAVRERLTMVDDDAAPYLVERSRLLLARLEPLWPDLPRTVIHGGCRRGSLLFTGPKLTGLLDFDSARPDVRVLDLAIAVHDLGKVYTALGHTDHKVALDLRRVAAFLRAYGELLSLTATEAKALPLLVAAKRAQRALARVARLTTGEPLSTNDVAKIRMETARLTWLHEHEAELIAICAAHAGG
jgi:homoserine kinase type II